MILQAMKQALEALEIIANGTHEEHLTPDGFARSAIPALHAAIEQAEKAEPAAWSYRSKINGDETLTHQPSDRVIEPEQFHIQPLYTHPAQPPEGWQLVPVVATPAMAAAMYGCESGEFTVQQAWKRILAAAPKEKS